MLMTWNLLEKNIYTLDIVSKAKIYFKYMVKLFHNIKFAKKCYKF